MSLRRHIVEGDNGSTTETGECYEDHPVTTNQHREVGVQADVPATKVVRPRVAQPYAVAEMALEDLKPHPKQR